MRRIVARVLPGVAVIVMALTPAAFPQGGAPGNHLIENGVESLAVVPGPEAFKDPFSGFYFPATLTVTSVDGSTWRLRATGSGGRKRLVFKVYGAALYVDDTAYLGPDPLVTLVNEDFARRMVMRFKRNASPERIQSVFEEAIGKLWNGDPGPDVRPAIDMLLSYFEGGVRKGQTLEFTYLPEKGLYTSVGGVAKPVITNPIVARRIWELWIGKNPLSPDLRRDLVRFVTEEQKKGTSAEHPEDAGH